MKQEEKELLLKDLCARLPYGVKITNGIYTVTLKVRIDTAPATLAQFINSEGLTYYLRPMSSMTEEEYSEYENYIALEYDELAKFKNQTIFYNKHHLDYNGLISKGLALVAPEGMYDIK